MGLCGWIVFGFFAGLLARAVMPGEQRMGFLRTTALGVVGSFVGGVLTSLLWGGDWRALRPSGFIGAVLGALLLLVLGRVLQNRRS